MRGDIQISKEEIRGDIQISKEEIRGDIQTLFRLARACNFLAEFELAKTNYQEAKKLAQTAIEIFRQTLTTALFSPILEKEEIILYRERHTHLVRYLFSLAKAEKYLGETQAAIANFEQAKNTIKLEHNSEIHIDILTELQEIYDKNKEYLKAFQIKQEKLKIEQKLGIKAFIGANPLGEIKENINPALTQSQISTNQPEIPAFGRQLDVENLMQRISRPDYKLILIYGQPGVGKSSILQAGLIPVLEQKLIDTSGVVVVLQRVYVNWISELGKTLAEQLQITQNLAVKSESLSSTEAIFAQLENNDKSNLMTVLIFDQFEDFFFVNREPKDKQEFARFLQNCWEIPFVKIVFSLREDYINYLSDFNSFGNLEVINNDILSEKILYYLGNFSQSQAISAIQELTEKSQFKIDYELTEKLVADLAEELGEIPPMQLQVVGKQLQRENITTLAKYQNLGNNPIAELIKKYLVEVVKDCGSENEKSAWLVLLLLTDENNNRPLKTKAELVEESQLNLDKLELILNIFFGSGLVFLLPEKPASCYQLVHDYLVWFIREKESTHP